MCRGIYWVSWQIIYKFVLAFIFYLSGTSRSFRAMVVVSKGSWNSFCCGHSFKSFFLLQEYLRKCQCLYRHLAAQFPLSFRFSSCHPLWRLPRVLGQGGVCSQHCLCIFRNSADSGTAPDIKDEQICKGKSYRQKSEQHYEECRITENILYSCPNFMALGADSKVLWFGFYLFFSVAVTPQLDWRWYHWHMELNLVSRL